MPIEMLKDQNYRNLGGINVKASVYMTGEGQVLDLRNYCFERPNAWTTRPGITDFYTLAKSTYGSTPTSMYQWNSANYIKSQSGAGQTSTAGASFVVFDSGANVYGLNFATVVTFSQSMTPGKLSFVSETTSEYTGNLKDYLYMANGNEFKVFSTGNPTLGTWPYTTAINYNFPQSATIFGITFTTAYPGGSLTPWPSGTHTVQVLLGKRLEDTSNNLFYNNIFFSEPSNPAYYYLGATQTSPNSFAFQAFFQVPPNYGYNMVAIKYTSPLGGVAYYSPPQEVFTGYPTYPNFYFFTLTGSTGTLAFKQFSSIASISGIPNVSLVPRFLESYKNMMFMAGFSLEPNQVRSSNIGTYLFSGFENSFDILPGQSKEITCLIKFQDTLIVFKDTSIYEISGDSPETLTVRTITTEYGCVNDRAAVTFNNKLWFVDKKGICEYNGPDTFIVSYPVETFFKDLTVSNFRAMYVKSQNQVWFASDGVVLVYDYDVKAWTIYDIIPINSNTGSYVLQKGESLPQPSWITASTSFFFISGLDPLSETDRGQNITTSFKTRYHKRMGETTEEMWRRFYVDIYPGANVTMTANLLGNYSASVSATRYAVGSTFQSKLEFGFPARSMAIQTFIKAPTKITINGYTVESRFVRNV